MRKYYKLAEFHKYHELKNRKPITGAYGASSGDFISVWDSELSRNWEFQVIGREGWENVLIVKPLNKPKAAELKINVAKQVTYVLHSSEVNDLRRCECGAIHTSDHNVHMFYCPLWTSN